MTVLVHLLDSTFSLKVNTSFVLLTYFTNIKVITNKCLTQGHTRAIVKGGGTMCVRISAQKKIWGPPTWQQYAPLKNPFFEKILIPFLFFLPPLPFGLVLFTIKIHQKDYFFGCY